MQKNNKQPLALFGSVKILVFAALLCAVSGVMKFIAPSGDTWRISLENFPIIFGGITMGSIIGGVVGIVADLLGCLFRGYAINPLITLASMSVGLISGLCFRLLKRYRNFAMILSVFWAHIIGNVIIKTVVLHSMFGTPIAVLFAERIVTYCVTAAVECVIIIVLLNNKAIKKGLGRVIGYDEL